MAKRSADITLLLTILVGAFLLLDGIGGLTRANSVVGELGRAFGARGSTINMIVAVVEVIAGGLLLVSRFVNLGQIQRYLGIGILITWIAIMVLTFLLGNFAPDALGWWTELVQYSIILAVIWMIKGA